MGEICGQVSQERCQIPKRIVGKAEEDGNSQVWLRCRNRRGKVWEQGTLWNAFSEKLGEASAVVRIPSEVHFLERLYLYCYEKRKVVWYGGGWMELADIPSEGVDVSDGPRGEPIVLRPRCLTVITYEDGLAPVKSPSKASEGMDEKCA